MIQVKTILNNVSFTFFISSNFSKFMHLSRRPFSRADENILNSAESLSSFSRSGGARTESNNVVAENSKLGENVRNLSVKVKPLEPVSEKNDHLLSPKKEKGSLSALFANEKKGQSKSKTESVDRSAYGLGDPMVSKELSSDMKMFLQHLYDKGYLRDAKFMPTNKFDSTFFEASYAREFLKFAALNFGKDHPDIAGWLSAGDLKKVALFGCPSLGQRTVYAAKHMRKFFKIDEQKVCQACTLKKLCSHRNKSSNKPSTKLHLASVIRVLLMYAMEAVPQKLVVPEEIKNSVSQLIKEIIGLSEDTSRGFPSHSCAKHNV